MKQRYLFIILLLALFARPSLAQTTYTVSNGDDGGTGSLREAINLANANPGADIIAFSPAVTSVTLTTAQLSITQSLTILGASTLCPATASGGTTIQRASTAPNFRIFAVSANITFFLQDLTLANGRLSSGSGAGISASSNSQLTLARCLIRDCTAQSFGGGIRSTGYMNMSDCMIVNNLASFDGGIYLQSLSSSPVNRIRNVTFLNNAATGGNNSGAMFFFGGELLMENSTLSQNNVAGGAEAAFYVSSFPDSSVPASATLNHVTVYETNSTKPALRTFAFSPSPATLLLMNSLVVSPNPIFRQGGTILSGGGNVFSNAIGSAFTSQPSDKINVGMIPIDLQPLATNGGCTLSHAIGCSSVAANAGVSTTLTTDQRGAARFGSAPDAGSYEVQSMSVAITQQPASGSSVCVGSTVTVGVGATGTPPLSYQWYKDGVSLGASQQQPTLLLSNVQTAQSGSYSVVVTGCNSVTSSVFSLSVSDPPANPSLVASGPLTCAQTSVTLTASTSSGGSFSYAFSGPGVSNASPTAGTATANVAGTYSVNITNLSAGCFSTTSVVVVQSPNTIPTVTLVFNNSATVMGTGVPTITVPNTPGQIFQVFGGSRYERVIVLDRINGYEIRQVDSNTTGVFAINRLGLFSITVTTAEGCSRTVQGILANP